MNWKKILLFFFFPPYWIYLDFKIALRIIQLLFDIFIRYPLAGVTKGLSFLTEAFEESLHQIESHYKKFSLVLLVLFSFLFLQFGLELNLSSGMLRESLVILLLSFLIPLALLFPLNIVRVLKGRGTATESAYTDSEGFIQTGGAAERGLRRGAEAMGDMAEEGELEMAEGVSRDAVKNDIINVVKRVFEEDLPFGESIAAGLEGASVGIGTILFGIVILIVVVVFLFVIQLALFLFIFSGVVGKAVASLTKPVADMLGFGELWAGYIGEQAGDAVSPIIQNSEAVEETAQTVGQAKARIFCLMKGPSCLRQWRLNNTKRPGSEAVGEEYGLKVRSFKFGTGERVDVAARPADYKIPARMLIYNVRRGLKGINAYNVKYRIIVSEDGKTQCDTLWKPVRGYDVDNDGNKDDLYPGTSGRPRQAEKDETGYNLTLGDCGMLQPALGQDMNVKLLVKYDYSSRTSLSFNAYSINYATGNPNIKPTKTYKKSRTADTPVKSAINVMAPVLFRKGSNKRSLETQVYLYTDNNDVKYKLKSLHVNMSDRISLQDDARCRLESADNWGEGANTYVLKTKVKNRIEQLQKNSWFEEGNKPGPFGCFFTLDTSEINPSGETMISRMDAKYTVALENSISSFEAWNSRCGTYNCPFLVTYQYNQSQLKYNLRTHCDGWDAGNGCSVVKGGKWAAPVSERLLTGGGNIDEILEPGEVAFAVEPSENDFIDQSSGNIKLEKDAVIGLTPKVENKLRQKDNHYLLANIQTDDWGWDIRYYDLSKEDCPEKGSGKSADISYFSKEKLEEKYKKDKNQVLAINKPKCGGSSGTRNLPGRGPA